jgi:signal transduction histidine kinase
LPDALLAVVLVVILVPASLPLVLDSTASGTVKVELITAIVVAQITVAFRRSHPSIAYLVCAGAMAVVLSTPPLTGLEAAGFAEPLPAILLPSSGVFLVLLYSVAAEGVGRIPIMALLVAAVGAALTAVRLLSATIISTIVPGGWPLPVIVVGALAAVVVAAWSLGRFVRFRKDYILSLAERARQAEAERELRAVQAAERERARIAREMHDVVSHSLAVIVAQAEAGRMAAGKDPVLGVAVLPTIATTGRAAMADMRSLLGVLRDEAGDADGDTRERTRGSPKRPGGDAYGAGPPANAGRPAASQSVLTPLKMDPVKSPLDPVTDPAAPVTDPAAPVTNPAVAATDPAASLTGLAAPMPERAAPMSGPAEPETDPVAPMPNPVAPMPGPAAPMPGLVDIPALVNRVSVTGIPVVLQGAGEPGQLDPAAELTAYRVVQEALTNVVKHSREPTSVVVQLVWTAESLRISVVDDGRGPIDHPVAGNTATGGLGLRGMRERVEAVGGTLTIGREKELGFQVDAEILFRTDISIQGGWESH